MMQQFLMEIMEPNETCVASPNIDMLLQMKKIESKFIVILICNSRALSMAHY